MSIIGSLALRSLKKNRTSTVVTLVGIVLSFSLMFSVLLFTKSFINFYGDAIRRESGNAELIVDYIGKDAANRLKMPDQVDDVSRVAWLGAAKFDEAGMSYNYYNVIGFDPDDSTFRVSVQEGRLPEKEGEAVISEWLSFERYGHFQIGDSITVPLFYL